jgi:hypothetical protein
LEKWFAFCVWQILIKHNFYQITKQNEIGMATFIAFIIFGTIPLIPYCVDVGINGPSARATGN